jgi:DNA-binding LacI/PurR family transcriptional regulator
MPTRITQIDIARHLGIGQKTVSRALGAPGYVSPAMRERVLAAAESLGYRRHASAATMRTGRFHSVILLQGMLAAASNLTPDLLRGIHDHLAAHELALTLARFDDRDLSSEQFLPRTLRELAADGLLVKYDINVPPGLAEHIARHALPAIWINSKRAEDAVHPDDFGAGALATEHLQLHGHRRIAYLDTGYADNPIFHYSREDRRQGYRQQLTRSGGQPAEILRLDLAHDQEPAAALAAGLDALGQPSGVVCYGGGDAALLLRAAALRGWRVPQDLSLVAIAGGPLELGLRVDSVLAADRTVGEVAAEMLVTKIAAPDRRLPTREIPYIIQRGLSVAARS